MASASLVLAQFDGNSAIFRELGLVQEVPKFPEILIDLSLRALGRVSGSDSEVCLLWGGVGRLEAWHAEIESIAARLLVAKDRFW